MIMLDKKTIEELDKLINIAKKHRDGDISESLFLDVISKNNKDNDFMSLCKDYLKRNGVVIVSLDDEIEDSVGEEEVNQHIKPYDTKLIDISPKPLSLDMIISRLENDEIDLMPDFQRKSGLWDNKQKSQLIESLILRIPLPAFYFDGSSNDMWIVIDGLQRLTAIKEFFVDQTLILSDLEFLKDLNNLKYDDLPRSYVRRMKETQIITYIINPGAPINLKYNIFKRINTGGLQLEPQEIRHALYQGYSTEYLKKLANSDIFKEATGYSIRSDRMMDREFVLRFIAFYEFKIDKYAGPIDEFLNSAMDYINNNYDEYRRNEVERIFNAVLLACELIFDKFAFRRMPDTKKRRPISKALFETWTSTMANYGMNEIQLLIDNKDFLLEEYQKMFSDDEFVMAIGGGKVSDYKRRFEKINSLINEVLQYAKSN